MKKMASDELNKRIVQLATKVAKAVELECEEVLDDAEKVARRYVPARALKAALSSMEAKLDVEGLKGIKFDTSVTRADLRRTAADEVSHKELEDAVKSFVEAIVDELEDVLEDADDVMGDEAAGLADDSGADVVEIEAKLKSVVERKLTARGINTRFSRKGKTAPAKKTAGIMSRMKQELGRK